MVYEPARNPAQRVHSVGVIWVVMRADRQGQPHLAALQQGGLPVDPAGAGAPAALLVERPARGADVPDAPAPVSRLDRVEQVQGEAPVAGRDVVLQMQEELGL